MPTALAGPILVPAGLSAGDQYRLVFVTTTSTDATSSSNAFYNSFVTSAAGLDPALGSLGTTWTAIASTPAVAASDNSDTNPSSAGLPIYNLAGQLVATSNSALWSGTLTSSIKYDENGVPSAPGFTEVWTGTGSTGVPDDPGDPLGNAMPAWGDATSTTSTWIDFPGGYYPEDGYHTLYAISGPLTVIPGDVNHDGIVNAQDIALVASDWLKTGTNIGGDANGDGIVNSSDISTIAANWMANASSPVSQTSGVATVPEPSTFVLAALGGLAVMAWRWR